uniref:Sulfatase N-terminal domain-containing protein n=1 Tax=Timema bartmani TaxID=61472 RepID=A0A7R9EPY5_9NEOP|nr:unnamed protein product [Timema bartmani]
MDTCRSTISTQWGRGFSEIRENKKTDAPPNLAVLPHLSPDQLAPSLTLERGMFALQPKGESEYPRQLLCLQSPDLYPYPGPYYAEVGLLEPRLQTPYPQDAYYSGWNDVGFHGSNQIPTPNIDALAYSGLILNNYYTPAICTPSRSALMTGRHPTSNGMQHTVLYGAEPRGLPLSEKLLPQYLKELGYATHIVGKWHLGHFQKEYTPTYRGFDSHLGLWTGHHDYFDHTAHEGVSISGLTGYNALSDAKAANQNYWGMDMRRGLEPAWDLHGQYSTDVFTNEAVKLIEIHNFSRPLFLYLAHAAVHSSNPYNPLPAPDSVVAKYAHLQDYTRQRFAGVLHKLDESVGKVVAALQKRGLLQNSIVVFTTDNGGPAAGFNINAASNWPLRGVKNTLWEGGVRGAALIWSPRLVKSGRVASQLFHMTDWLPTLYYAAGGDLSHLGDIDGLNTWEALSKDSPSNRTQVLHNIDDEYGNAALTVDDWKIVKGTSYQGYWDSWYGPSGRENSSQSYDIDQVLGSMTGKALTSLQRAATPAQILTLRTQAEVRCDPEVLDTISPPHQPCKPLEASCFYPDILRHLEQTLSKINATVVPPSNLALDPRADPNLWDHTWTNFGDHRILSNTLI